jgi:hypothetical protein
MIAVVAQEDAQTTTTVPSFGEQDDRNKKK